MSDGAYMTATGDYDNPEPPPPWDDDEPRELDDDETTRVKVRAEELRARLLDAAGLQTIPPPAPLVDGWLFKDSLAWLGGKPGHGKTFVAVELAGCVATGLPWHGHNTTAGRVLYVIAEGAAGLGVRVEAWALANGTRATNIRFLPVPVNLAQSLDVSALAALLDELQPALVVVDTQARVTLGLDENSSRDMGLFVEVLERLRRESGACLLVVHHEPRTGDNLRGSTALEGAAATILRAGKDGQIVTVTNPKQKDAEQAVSIALALTPLARSCFLSHEGVGISSLMTESENHILSVLWESFGNPGATKTELRDAADLPKSTYYRCIKALVNAGKVVEQREGRSTRYLPAVVDDQLQIPTSPTSVP